LSSTPASQWYKVHLCRIRAQEIAVFCGGCIRNQAGDIILDGRLLHNGWTDFDSVCRGLLGSPPATQWYMIHLSAIFIHDFTGSRLGGGLRRPEGGLHLNVYFGRRLPMSIGVSMWISLYITSRTIVE